MPLKNDLSRSLAAFEQDRTLVVVLEISLSTWLVAGLVPGVVRQPTKKLRGGSGNLDRYGEWSFCLTAARMAAEQERR
jgi:hypothetical protein